MKDELKLIKQTTQELLEKLGFSDLNIKVQSTDEEVVNVQIEVSPQDSGMLIGFHGETLSSLQLIVSQIVYKKLDKWHRLVINIGDYRQKREKSL
jgi:spoIIIJ-associated protein